MLVQVVSFICIFVSFCSILYLLQFKKIFLLSLVLTIIYKRISKRVIIKTPILILITIVVFFFLMVMTGNIVAALILVIIFIASIFIDRLEAEDYIEEKKYIKSVNDGEIEYKSAIISNKENQYISIYKEVPFPKEKLGDLKIELNKYKSKSEERTIFGKFKGYFMHYYDVKRLRNSLDLDIPYLYTIDDEMTSDELFYEVCTIIDMGYSYKELNYEKMKVLLKWIFNFDIESNNHSSCYIFDVENIRLYNCFLRNYEFISKENYKYLKELNSNLEDYEDKLGNKILFIDYKK